MHLERRVAVILTAGMLAAACGGARERSGGLDPQHVAGGGGTGGGATIDVATGGTYSSAATPDDGDAALSNCEDYSFDGCVGEGFEGESVPLDIYVMFDMSGSMLNDVGGMTRLAAVQQAMQQFLRDPASAGIGVGIGYFGFEPIGSTSCDEATYSRPDVAVTQDHEAIIASLDARMPTGETPTGAAIRGACDYARSERTQHPERALVNLLVTDGTPEAPVSCAENGCCPTLDDAVQAASGCAAGRDGVATYVLGVGPELDNLDQIASAGNTQAAYLVGNDDVTSQVLAALNKIRGDAVVPCNLEIPTPTDGKKLDYTQLNLVYSTSGCNFVPAYHVDAQASCDASGGWYYDDPNSPSSVTLCPATCDAVSVPGAALRFSVGCQSLSKPVR
ncbi:MAG TPA: vWA domain-containing protein [Polyangiaceae bacterium]|nr:vWA domain-containing protein [Polyangiaceae bacterium]